MNRANVVSIGIDIGGTAMKWCARGSDGVDIDSGSRPTPQGGVEAVLAAIIDIAAQHPDARSLGIAVPGTVDIPNRRSVFIPNLPGDWSDVAIGDRVEDLTGLPVAVLNDARAFGHAELAVGAARDLADVVFVTLGTGVGGAIARNGRLVLGDLDAVGEVGHVPVDPWRGSVCGCGGRGCLETIASASAIVERLTNVLRTEQSSVLSGHLSRGTLTAESAAQAARAGDLWAVEAFERAGRGIGIAIAAAAVLVGSRTAVLGGGLAAAFDLLAPAAERVLEERRSVTGSVTVAAALLGPEAGAIGAALYATQVRDTRERAR